MVFPSSYIAQSVAAQNSMFSGLQAYSMQASYGAGLMGGGPTPPMPQMMPPPPAPVTLGAVARGYGGYGGGPTAGAYGEALAGRMVSMGQTGMGLAGAGMTALGAASSLGLVGGTLGTVAGLANPMSWAGSAAIGAYGMAGGGMAGLAAGGLAGGAIALPIYAGARYISAIGQNFAGGMQDQMALNSTLRQNFNFLGGQGAYNRGFSQQQMGQIGGMVSQELRSNIFTSAGELNQVIAGGAQMGSFTGVRDVQEFGRRFREMLTTLRTVQRELGGNLTEALEFVNQSRQAGVFGSTQATRFAGTIRAVSASTGMDQGQLIQLASQGAQIARSVGGVGSQGAFGAMRGISQVGAMMNRGMIDESMLSEATGGLTGTDAMQSFVTDMMQRTARFSRRAHGRYSIFGLANASGTGLDEAALLQYQMGDMGVGDLSRRAHRNVGRMGRADAINREGLLRGALLEQGGIGGMLGGIRQIIGDRAADQGDDLTSLVIQRRMGVNRSQAEILTSMLRNQGELVRSEATDRASSARESALRTDVRENRSFDAFYRHLEHSVSEGLGLTRVREMGREFVTNVSSRIERTLNALSGIVDTGLTQSVRDRMGRMATGAGTDADRELTRFALEGATSRRNTGMDLFRRTAFQVNATVGERMEAMGFNVSGFGVGTAGRLARETGDISGVRGELRGYRADGSAIYSRASEMSARSVEANMARMSLAASGVVGENTPEAAILARLEADRSGTNARLANARAAATGSGDPSQFATFFAGRDRSGRSLLTGDLGVGLTAYMAREGFVNPNAIRGTDIATAGRGGFSFGESILAAGREGLGEGGGTRFGYAMAGAAALGAAGSFGGPVGTVLGAIAGGIGGYFLGDEFAANEMAANRDRLSALAQEGFGSAEDYFRAGGGARANLLREAADRRSGARSTYSRGGQALRDRLNAEAAELEARAAALGEVVDQPAMQEVLAREDVRTASRMLLSEDSEERNRAVDILNTLYNTESNEASRTAINSLRENATRVAANPDDPTARAAFRRAALPADEEAAIVREAEAAHRSFGVISRAMGEASGVSASIFRNAAGSSLADQYDVIEMGADQLASLSDEEFQAEMNRMGTLMHDLRGADVEEHRETLRGFMAQATFEHGRARELMGRGRRGMRASRESALQMLSGGLGSMEFTIGGRRVSSRNVSEMLLGRGGGGRHSAELMEQFQAQLGNRIGAPGAETVVSTLRDVYRDNEVTDEERRRLTGLRDRFGSELRGVEEEQRRAALSSASARDPVGAETNRLLGTIQQTLEQRLAGPENGGPNMSTAGGPATAPA